MMNSTTQSRISERFSRCAGLISMAVTLCTFVGCADKSPQRMAVSGTVSLDTKPVGNATIVFTPIGHGLAAAAVIENGNFAMTEENGPTIGEFHVRINPMEAEIEQVNPTELSGANRRPLVPKIYQREGKLRATISAEPNQKLEFKLLSSEK
jgi:hypothetical protein